MVQEMGQLQAGHLPTVPDRLSDTQVSLSRSARVRFTGGEHMRQGDQQLASGLRPAGREEGLCGMCEGSGLPVRGPFRPLGGVDRAATHPGCRQDILLSATSAPEHQQGARPLRVQRPSARDAADVAGRAAERTRFPAPVLDQKGQSQAAKRTDTI